jgi:ParB-like chromosome segregation protein Spo0J
MVTRNNEKVTCHGRARATGATGGMTAKAFHRLADLLPLTQGAEFDRLVADIAEHGLLNPITLYQGQVLDGRNRALACRAAGIEPRYVEYEGKDPAAFVLSQNLARRHLGPSERAMVAARMATLKWGQRSDRVEGQICLSKAAQLLDVSERSVKSARVVLDHGIPELREAVEHGRLAVHEAEKAARLPGEAQMQFLEASASGKTFSAWQTNYGRKERAAELEAATRALPVGQKQWPVILVDPPWDYKISVLGREHSHPAQHYRVMSLAEICALPVADLAAESCVLFLWTTAPCLEQAFEVIRAWGFEYKSNLVWDKELIGMGHWVRGQHELLLVGSKGTPRFPQQKACPRPSCASGDGNIPASPKCPTASLRPCTRPYPRSSYSPANRGRVGTHGGTRWEARQRQMTAFPNFCAGMP